MNKDKFIEELTQDNLETGRKLEEIHKTVWENRGGDFFGDSNSDKEGHKKAGRLFNELLEERMRKILRKINRDQE